MNRFRIAHLSDPHLPLAPARPRLRDLMGKRAFSWLSWRRHRRHVHRPEVLAALMRDVTAHAPDHLAVTGDLTNLALPDEFARARDWLAAAGTGATVTAVPGNHDALVPVAQGLGLALWADWMGGAAAGFPFVKRLGEVALVGVSTAVPTGLFLAGGRVGEDQLARLEAMLGALRDEGLFRIVMIHHPVTEGAVSGRKALWDQAALRAVLARAGAELILHGHSHLPTVESTAGPAGPIPVLSVPSASASPDEPGPPAGWSLIEIVGGNASWRIAVTMRALGPGDRGFGSVRTLSFEAPRPVL